jgi:hypothetical protein
VAITAGVRPEVNERSLTASQKEDEALCVIPVRKQEGRSSTIVLVKLRHENGVTHRCHERGKNRGFIVPEIRR